mgnify:CR=1 FL=1
MYRQQILDHYKNPRNYGELEGATFEHVGENPMCGDTIKVFVKLEEDGETVERVSFVGDGCAISQASASMLTGELRGMTLDEVRELDRDDVLDMLGVEVTGHPNPEKLLLSDDFDGGPPLRAENLEVSDS